MNARLCHFGQTGEARCHGNWVTGEGTRLINRTGWRQRIHHVTSTAEGAYRHTAADDFAKAGQIRHHVVVGLRPSQRHAEAGHHFIDNQQRAELVTQRAQARQEISLRWNAVHVAGNRFNDDAGNILWELLERRAYGRQIVIGAGESVLSEIGRYTR